MNSRKWGKLICLLLCAVMIIPWGMQSNAYAEGDNTSEKLTIEGDYYNQYTQVLYQDGNLTCSDDSIRMSVDSKSGALVINGAKKALTAAEFAVGKEYNFDGNAVGRFSIDATSAKGQSVTLGFYIDDQTEPFMTKKLYKQREKKSWGYSKDYSFDIYDLKLTGKHTLKFKVLDASEKDVSFCIKSFEFVESSVPVVYFNIDETEGTIGEMNSSIDHSVECYGDMTIQVPDGYVSEYTGKELKTETYSMEYIRGRGNSTWGEAKKPYKIKLEKKADLLGLGKNKHWVLLANHFDNSLLRNKITYWLGDEMGMEYTPQSEPVDVIMNGEYYGSYFLCEQVRVGESRVEVDDLEDTPDATELPDISGGYLLSLYPYDSVPANQSFITKRKMQMTIESPEFEDYFNEAQYNYIKNYVQEVEDAIFDGDYEKYSQLMDIPAAVKYWWFQEFSLNGDGYVSGSTYLYKKRDGKLYWGPLWDFDYVAWGSTEYDNLMTSGWQHNQAYMGEYGFVWAEALFEDKEFTKEILAAWPAMKTAVEQLIAPGGQLDKYKEKMQITARYNFERLGQTNFGWDDDPIPQLTYDQEIERLREWISKRLAWVDSNVDTLIPEETTVTYKGYDGKTVAKVPGVVGKSLKNIPAAPERKGYVFMGWEYSHTITYEEYLNSLGYTEEALIEAFKEFGMSDEEIEELLNELREGMEDSGIVYDSGTVYKDMVLTATYMLESEVQPVKKIYFDKSEYYVTLYDEEFGDTYETQIQYQVTPFDATFTDLTWSSSDESIATVEDGVVTVLKRGDVEITATASNGVSRTVTVHAMTFQELDEIGGISWYGYVEPEKSITKGGYAQLEVYPSEGVGMEGNAEFFTTDDSVVEVGSAGVVHGIKAGTATVICIFNGEISLCQVTVKDTPVKRGTVVTRSGLKYKVTASTSKEKTVSCIGAASRSITKAVIPASITIKGKKYKVTKVADSAFKGYKKLKKVTIKADKAAIGSGAFKDVPKTAVFYVKEARKSYYKKQLKGRTVYSYDIKVGSTVTRSGLKYKVTKNSAKAKAVTCIGSTKKKVSKVKIPATININGKKYKVTQIKDSAFKAKKSLKSVVIGSNVEIIGKSAFSGCKKLTKVTIKAKEAKIYKSTFNKVPKKAKFYVKKSQKKYYKVVLKNRKVKTL